MQGGECEEKQEWLAVYSSRVLRVGDRVANSGPSLSWLLTPRADLTQTLAALLFFNTRPQHTPHPPPLWSRTLRCEAPPPLCDSSCTPTPPGQARGSGSSINNPELSLRREHALGSFTFQCLWVEGLLVDSNGLQPCEKKKKGRKKDRERRKRGENKKNWMVWFFEMPFESDNVLLASPQIISLPPSAFFLLRLFANHKYQGRSLVYPGYRFTEKNKLQACLWKLSNWQLWSSQREAMYVLMHQKEPLNSSSLLCELAYLIYLFIFYPYKVLRYLGKT